jgi:hypothetical protein
VLYNFTVIIEFYLSRNLAKFHLTSRRTSLPL